MLKWLRKIRQNVEPKALILMYHRVDEPDCDPWQLAVSPANFEQQLQQLTQDWRPVSLSELIQGITAGSIADRSIAVTFDDGYIDNFVEAKPLLEKYQVPATFFIVTKNCGQPLPFWWDELQAILLHTPDLPEHLSLAVSDDVLTFDLSAEAVLTPFLQSQHERWTAAEGALTVRTRVYDALWRRLRPLPDREQQAIMAELRQWAGLPLGSSKVPTCMTTRHVQQLAANRLFSIGAHTMTHPALADHSEEVQAKEARGSRLYLEALLGHPVSHFAYPYGSHNAASLGIAEQEFASAVTTNEGVITRSSDPRRLHRYQVKNWDSATFNTKLRQWFNRN